MRRTTTRVWRGKSERGWGGWACSRSRLRDAFSDASFPPPLIVTEHRRRRWDLEVVLISLERGPALLLSLSVSLFARHWGGGRGFRIACGLPQTGA